MLRSSPTMGEVKNPGPIAAVWRTVLSIALAASLVAGACSSGDENQLGEMGFGSLEGTVDPSREADAEVITAAIQEFFELGAGSYVSRDTFSAPSAGGVTEVAHGYFSADAQASKGTWSLEFSGVDVFAIAENVEVFDGSWVLVDSTFYFKSRFESDWYRIDPSVYGIDPDEAEDEEFEVTVPVLDSDSLLPFDDTEIAVLAPTTINGVQAQGYRVQVPSWYALRLLNDGISHDVVSRLGTHPDLTATTPTDVWLADGTVLAVRADFTPIVAEAAALLIENRAREPIWAEWSVTTEVVFFDRGVDQEVLAPSSSLDGLGPGSPEVGIDGLVEGMCLANPDLGWDGLRLFEPTPCGRSKRYLVFATFPADSFEPEVHDDYESSFERQTSDRCAEALLERYNIAKRNSLLSVVSLAPLGEQQAACILEAPEPKVGDIVADKRFSGPGGAQLSDASMSASASGNVRIDDMVGRTAPPTLVAVGAANRPDDEMQGNAGVIWVSSDGGETFQQAATPPAAAPEGSSYFSELTLLPDRFLVVGQTYGEESRSSTIWQGSAGGSTWQPTALPTSLAEEGVSYVRVDPSTNRWVAVGTDWQDDDGARLLVWFTDDEGASWEQAETPDVELDDVWSMRNEDGRWVVQASDWETYDDVAFVSPDGAETWSISTDDDDLEWRSAESVATGSGLLRQFPLEFSGDDGRTWLEVELPTHDRGHPRVESLAVGEDNTVVAVGQVLLRAGGAPAVWISRDAGRQFELVIVLQDNPGEGLQMSSIVHLGDQQFSIVGNTRDPDNFYSGGEPRAWLLEVLPEDG